MGLLMTLFWVAVVIGIILLIRAQFRVGNIDDGRSPIEILKERYARGEIGDEDFERIRNKLNEKEP